MKIINHQERFLISGGSEFYEFTYTQHVSTEGISEGCVSAFLKAVIASNNHEGSDEEIISTTLKSCSLAEFDLLIDRLDKAAIQSISLS